MKWSSNPRTSRKIRRSKVQMGSLKKPVKPEAAAGWLSIIARPVTMIRLGGNRMLGRNLAPKHEDSLCADSSSNRLGTGKPMDSPSAKACRS